METVVKKPESHFVLVHGLCHGAWCWYRLATILRSAGHRVTAPDLAACGASPVRVDEVRSFAEYSRPLTDAVDAVPPGERVVLVGHSYGGYSLALAMHAHPDKIMEETAPDAATDSVPAVTGGAETFLLGPERLSRRLYQRSPPEDLALATAPVRPARWFLDDAAMTESVLTADRYGAFAQERGPGFFMDSVIETTGGDDLERACKTFLLGPEYMAQRLYQLSPAEDLTLATMLVRPSRRFVDDAVMNGEEVLTAERYGAVSRVYVVAEEDASWSPEFQRRMASWNPGAEVRGLQGADHMPMFSKPRELSDLLVEIADKYT
uniref:Uncharacterized protein n=1 Tax=Aegilops tauschii TaxID=37682 RepID=M8C1I8_AEGTA